MGGCFPSPFRRLPHPNGDAFDVYVLIDRVGGKYKPETYPNRMVDKHKGRVRQRPNRVGYREERARWEDKPSLVRESVYVCE